MTSEPDFFAAGPYRLAAGRYYDRETHLWVEPRPGDRVRCGFDPLGSETCGDIVAVSFEPAGRRIRRGEAFGNLEAAKFVGPLLAPVSGTLVGHNEQVLANPALLNRAPLEHWLVELAPDRLEDELGLLLHGREAVGEWFETEVRRFRRKGMLAE